jgi:DNA-binding PadR family transcriptional regulator
VNKTTYLGEFEHMILLAILRLGEDAYGMAIRDELEARAGRAVTRSAAYITLERLVKKGYLTPRMGEATPQRGGRAKRYYEITSAGREALRESGRALMNLWAGQESLLEEA